MIIIESLLGFDMRTASSKVNLQEHYKSLHKKSTMPVCAISNMSGYIPPSIYPGFNPNDNTILSETESSGSETFKTFQSGTKSLIKSSPASVRSQGEDSRLKLKQEEEVRIESPELHCCEQIFDSDELNTDVRNSVSRKMFIDSRQNTNYFPNVPPKMVELVERTFGTTAPNATQQSQLYQLLAAVHENQQQNNHHKMLPCQPEELTNCKNRTTNKELLTSPKCTATSHPGSKERTRSNESYGSSDSSDTTKRKIPTAETDAIQSTMYKRPFLLQYIHPFPFANPFHTPFYPSIPATNGLIPPSGAINPFLFPSHPAVVNQMMLWRELFFSTAAAAAGSPFYSPMFSNPTPILPPSDIIPGLNDDVINSRPTKPPVPPNVNLFQPYLQQQQRQNFVTSQHEPEEQLPKPKRKRGISMTSSSYPNSKKICKTSIKNIEVEEESKLRRCEKSSTSRDDEVEDQTEGFEKSRKSGCKSLNRQRRLVANARERTRVHTIGSAFEDLRMQIPSYSCNQKLSKLAILRIACSYIRTLSALSGRDVDTSFAQGVDQCTKVLQVS